MKIALTIVIPSFPRDYCSRSFLSVPTALPPSLPSLCVLLSAVAARCTVSPSQGPADHGDAPERFPTTIHNPSSVLDQLQVGQS